MSEKTRSLYEFGAFHLNPGRRMLVRNGEQIALTPKGFDTLLLLVQNRGRVLTKEELMNTLWPESYVEDANLSQNIFVLRKILGNDQHGNSFIQTIPKK